MPRRGTISTSQLSLSDVPSLEAAWGELSKFALTFDEGEIEYFNKDIHSLDHAWSTFSVTELRAFLFMLQRRQAHWGGPPDEVTLQGMRDIVREMRQKMSGSI